MDSYPGTTVNSEIATYHIDTAKIEGIADLARLHLGVGSHELAITFVDSPHIQELNRTYRGKDKATDVLSFPQCEFQEPLRVLPQPPPAKKTKVPQALGDIVISLPEAETNANAIGQGLDREVCFLIMHGLLHLCGHDHEEPAEEQLMLSEQNQLMEIVTKAKTPPLWQHCVEAGPSKGVAFAPRGHA